MKTRSGGNILVESLIAHGVKKVFCVPGESYLDVLDALVDAPDIRVITCRHEGEAAFMAEAYAKLTGHPGVCFVTRGPGACNASIGVHTAMQDSTPLLLFVGQVARDQKGREAFQEIEYRDMFKPPITKWATEIIRASEIPLVVKEAFELATTARPGPVVVALPEDMLCEESDAPVIVQPAPAHFAPSPRAVTEMEKILSTAKKPFVITGGGSWDAKSISAFESFCSKAHLPVATGFRRQDVFDNTHGCYAGALGTTVDPELCKAVADADVILAVGTRLSEMTTQGYTILTPPKPQQKLIHVYPDSSELNKVYKTTLAIHAPVAAFAAALAEISIDGSGWAQNTQDLHARYMAWSTIKNRDKFALDLDGVIEDILETLPADAIVTTDAGNFSGWAQRYLHYKRPLRLLAPTAGAMGYGAPAAVAASLACPERAVVGFMGDGGFLMTGAHSLATAMQSGAHPVFLVFDNGMYGTIRMHQEKHYPGRVSATKLRNPDFAALAKSYGAAAFTVTRTEEFLPVFKEALRVDKAVLIHLRMDPEQITTAKKLAELGKT